MQIFRPKRVKIKIESFEIETVERESRIIKVRSHQTRMTNKSRYSREVGRLNILSFLLNSHEKFAPFVLKFATQQTRIHVMGGASADSSSLVAKCIPVFVEVWRCIYSSGYPHTTTITLSSIVVSDFLPPLVMTSLVEQAPDWLTRHEYLPKFRFFNLRDCV